FRRVLFRSGGEDLEPDWLVRGQHSVLIGILNAIAESLLEILRTDSHTRPERPSLAGPHEGDRISKPEGSRLSVDRTGVIPIPIRGKENVTLTQDRKSTRLNSSHVKISYAVFCLKKKKDKNDN